MLSIQSMAGSAVATGIYRHYKGQFYQVLHCARHSETEEWLVIYRCLYDDYSVWARPVDMFRANVTLANGEIVPRFSLQIATEFTAATPNGA